MKTTVRVVGAGLGRTGTMSLKLALERLLGVPCYHMAEVFQHPAHISLWHAAVRGQMPDWHALLAGYGAVVDWPAASFWPELSEAFPEAVVLLSLRDPQSWWRSAHDTIFPATKEAAGTEWHAMFDELMATRFTNRLTDQRACIAAFERHNARVQEMVPSQRLLKWRPVDGWAPLCAVLGVPVPDEPFPHSNTTAEFLAAHGSE